MTQEKFLDFDSILNKIKMNIHKNLSLSLFLPVIVAIDNFKLFFWGEVLASLLKIKVKLIFFYKLSFSLSLLSFLSLFLKHLKRKSFKQILFKFLENAGSSFVTVTTIYKMLLFVCSLLLTFCCLI